MASRIRIFVVVALCVTAGYFAGRLFWPTPQADAPPEAATAAAPSRVPEFRLKDLAGAMRSSSEWSAQAVIINFWATWCAPCRKEMPLLEQVHTERSGQGLAVIGIAIDREDPVRTFIAETGVTYPILIGEGDAMAVAESFGPDFVGLPLTVIAAPGGDILKLHVGELQPGDLAAILKVLDQLASGSITLGEARKALEQA